MNLNVTQSVKIIILAIIIGGGIYIATATTPAPCASVSNCPVPQPVNVGSDLQIKSGSLGVGEDFFSFGESDLLGQETYIGFPTILGQTFPANLSVYGNSNTSEKGKFGDVAGGNYLEVGYDSAQSRSHIDAKNTGNSGLLLNYYSGGDVSLGGGPGGVSDLDVGGELTSSNLSNGTLHPVCADNNGNLILCP